jgi:hypothetical protein
MTSPTLSPSPQAVWSCAVAVPDRMDNHQPNQRPAQVLGDSRLWHLADGRQFCLDH